MVKKVRINQLIEQKTRAKLFILRSILKKSTMGEVIDEIMKRIKVS